MTDYERPDWLLQCFNKPYTDYTWLKEHCYRTLERALSPNARNEHLAILGLIDYYEKHEQTGGWTPISEELPKEDDTYEVTLKGVSELEGIAEVAFATWLSGRGDWLYHDVDDWQYKKVIAWRKVLPYKAESE